LLPDQTPLKEKHRDRQEHDNRGQPEAWLRRRQQNGAEHCRDPIGDRGGSPTLDEKAGCKLDDDVKIDADEKRAYAFGPKLGLESNGFARQKENRRRNKSQYVKSSTIDLRICHENACPPPCEQ